MWTSKRPTSSSRAATTQTAAATTRWSNSMPSRPPTKRYETPKDATRIAMSWSEPRRGAHATHGPRRSRDPTVVPRTSPSRRSIRCDRRIWATKCWTLSWLASWLGRVDTSPFACPSTPGARDAMETGSKPLSAICANTRVVSGYASGVRCGYRAESTTFKKFGWTASWSCSATAQCSRGSSWCRLLKCAPS